MNFPQATTQKQSKRYVGGMRTLRVCLQPRLRLSTLLSIIVDSTGDHWDDRLRQGAVLRSLQRAAHVGSGRPIGRPTGARPQILPDADRRRREHESMTMGRAIDTLSGRRYSLISVFDTLPSFVCSPSLTDCGYLFSTPVEFATARRCLPACKEYAIFLREHSSPAFDQKLGPCERQSARLQQTEHSAPQRERKTSGQGGSERGNVEVVVLVVCGEVGERIEDRFL